MTDFPGSLIEFQQRFSDEAACVRYLFAARWPEGFVCPDCGTSKAWELQTKAWTPACAGAGLYGATVVKPHGWGGQRQAWVGPSRIDDPRGARHWAAAQHTCIR